MEDIYNRSFFIILGLSFHYFYQFDYYIVIPFLLAVCISLLQNMYADNPYIKYVSYAYMAISLYSIVYIFYFPLFLYHECRVRTWRTSYVIFIAGFFLGLQQLPIFTLFLLMGFSIAAVLLKYRYMDTLDLQHAYVLQRDATKELANVLQDRNDDLIIKQAYEIKIATLNERNRIAREIHDNVGHLLSSSLLQVGALQAIHQEETWNDSLQSLRTTISTAMDTVRTSVHDLHEESIDFEIVINNLMDSYTFCPISLEYSILHPLAQHVIAQFLAIIKECMNNTMKHSNATLLQIILREQHDFYQFIIHDNGTHIRMNSNGIGLKNIQDRIDAMHGYVNINITEGFQVFITLPKEENQ